MNAGLGLVRVADGGTGGGCSRTASHFTPAKAGAAAAQQLRVLSSRIAPSGPESTALRSASYSTVRAVVVERGRIDDTDLPQQAGLAARDTAFPRGPLNPNDVSPRTNGPSTSIDAFGICGSNSPSVWRSAAGATSHRPRHGRA